MNNIGICVNLEKDADFCVTKNIISIIEGLGKKCEIASENKKYDIIISLGGDGTFLATSRKFFNNRIVGVNLGNLGFLSEIDKKNIDDKLKNILAGNFNIEKRYLLETELHTKKLVALNDIVISRGTITKLLELELYFNGKFVDNYVADGLIVSTPTGSTAYSLSAGGPIVEPKLNVLIISPICAHSMYQRPIIVSGDTEIRIESKVPGFLVAADGQESVESENIGGVSIKYSDKSVEIVKTGENCFFDTVRKKFHIK